MTSPLPPDEIRLVQEGFDIEARKWSKLAAEMGELKAKTLGMTLTAPAFLASDSEMSANLSAAYNSLHTTIRDFMSQAEEEFDQIADALRIAADRYDGTDNASATNLLKIYGRSQA